MTMPPIRAVCFDLDGLMFNTEELYVEVGGETLRRRGKELTRELLDKMMGRPGRVAMQIMIDEHQLDATVDELQAESDVLFTGLLESRLRPMPGLPRLLDALEAADLPRAVATSSRLPFTTRVLELFDFLKRFAFVLTAEDVVEGKPDPAVYQLAAAKFGVDPNEMMVLEDSENGCKSAVAAGTFAVAVPGDHSRDHSFAGAALTADSLADPEIYAALGLPLP